MLSDARKRQDYDQHGRESVEGSTVFTDAKRFFALVFGGAAFEPYATVVVVVLLFFVQGKKRTCARTRTHMRASAFTLTCVAGFTAAQWVITLKVLPGRLRWRGGGGGGGNKKKKKKKKKNQQ